MQNTLMLKTTITTFDKEEACLFYVGLSHSLSLPSPSKLLETTAKVWDMQITVKSSLPPKELAVKQQVVTA